MLGIGRFTAESAETTRQELGLPFPLCPDPDGLVVDRYSGSIGGSMVMARTAFYVIDSSGVVVYARVESGTVTPTTPEDILEVLGGLG